MHVMAGKIPKGSSTAVRDQMMKTYIENITYAADRLSKVSKINVSRSYLICHCFITCFFKYVTQ